MLETSSLEQRTKAKCLENEEQIKARLYRAIETTYEYVMFSTGVKWLGYGASIGFAVEGIEFFEPPTTTFAF